MSLLLALQFLLPCPMPCTAFPVGVSLVHALCAGLMHATRDKEDKDTKLTNPTPLN
jgi:hypothetical protein